MKFVFKYPEKVKALILNGGNLNTKGVKGTTQFFIELGYKVAKKFAHMLIKKDHTREIAGSIPDAKLVFVSGNHFIANKRSQAFNREVEKFCLEKL